jgi:hypothetical protein
MACRTNVKQFTFAVDEIKEILIEWLRGEYSDIELDFNLKEAETQIIVGPGGVCLEVVTQSDCLLPSDQDLMHSERMMRQETWRKAERKRLYSVFGD